MTEPSIIHVVGVTAVWIIFLSALRFIAVSGHGLKPVLLCLKRVARSRNATWADRRRWFGQSLDARYADLIIALTTPWSGLLLFGGMTLIGLGLSFGSVGDVVQLVARLPDRWSAFDRSMDFAGAIALSLGMSAVHAAVTRKRSLSVYVSIGFAVMGLGIGVVTAVRP
ncbi:hypothetical protein [Sphingomonas prati]|uniref:hypothetical protein n=1 Tax=Sphingomonas prati TaxID=1843237 RepID=UPI001662C62F|nr:hypothetical protein [Sphingomonas prati]